MALRLGYPCHCSSWSKKPSQGQSEEVTMGNILENLPEVRQNMWVLVGMDPSLDFFFFLIVLEKLWRILSRQVTSFD